MEKINVAELLKDCPRGMELECLMFEGLEFDSIVDHDYFPIRCRIKNSNDEYNFYYFTASIIGLIAISLNALSP